MGSPVVTLRPDHYEDTYADIAAAVAATPSKYAAGETIGDRGTGDIWLRTTDGLEWIASGGTPLVLNRAGSGGLFNADKSITNASQNEAVPAGAKSLTVKNISGTATDLMRFRFGADNSLAASLTTGFHLLAGQQSEPIPILEGQTWWAWIGNNVTPFNAMVIWGF